MSGNDVYDAIVLGGGPAGSCAAIALAQRGRRVLVVEREKFPRFCVGESLVPEVLAPLRRLGVLERIEKIGFVEKFGATFSFETGQPSNSIRFADRMGRGEICAFQVERAEFDDVLLRYAVECGAEVRQETRAREVELSTSGVRLQLQDAVAGASGTGTSSAREVGAKSWVEARFLIDASGQAAFLGKRLKLRREDPLLKNVAVFAHYEDWKWPEQLPPGDAHLVSRRDMGWVWLIPLRGRVSVGLVMPRRVESPPPPADRLAWFEARLGEMPILDEQRRVARRVTDLFTMADFGYSTSAYCGDRWLLAGDCGSFIDPVFSTGVFLSIAGGEDAATAVDNALQRPRDRVKIFRRFEREQRRRYTFFGRYVRSFYRPGVRDLLCQPAHELGIPRAWTTVLSGESHLSWHLKARLHMFFALAALQERVPITGRYHGLDAPDPIAGRRSASWVAVPD